MDNTYDRAAYQQTLYSTDRPLPDRPHTLRPPPFTGPLYQLHAPHDCGSYQHPPPFTGPSYRLPSYTESPGFSSLYSFEPTVPPPMFGVLPPGHFSGLAPLAPSLSSCSTGASPSAVPRYEQKAALDLQNLHERLLQEEDLQKKRDVRWVRWFSQNRGKSSRSPESTLRGSLYEAAQLLSQLQERCLSLKHNLEHSQWEDSYSEALRLKKELQDKTQGLDLVTVRGSLGRRLKVGGSRARGLKVARSQAALKRVVVEVELLMKQRHAEERETAIDRWRMKRIRHVEEKKKERELKLAADSVLCEVRKKQADVKRMQDILRSLEKLRRLRKEAASRKGIVTELLSEEEFGSRLGKLRVVMKKRMAIYSVEEKALKVMLEGEQEEEMKKERERRVKKEMERQLQRRHKVASLLFGEEQPVDCVLQPFTQFYSQAQHSLHTLIPVRKEWDVFLVAADHPDGSSVPWSWILPESPADRAWASALHTDWDSSDHHSASSHKPTSV